MFSGSFFLTVPCVGLQYVIVVFPDHILFLFYLKFKDNIDIYVEMIPVLPCSRKKVCFTSSMLG